MKHPDGLQVLVAIDQLVNTLAGGWADETLSSRAWRHKMDGSRSWPAWIIDHLFFGRTIIARQLGKVSLIAHNYRRLLLGEKEC